MHHRQHLAGGMPGHGRNLARIIHAVVNLQAPRHARGPTIQLLVKPVAQPADGLRENDSGSCGVGKRGERQLFHPHHHRHGQGAQRHRAPNAQTTAGDVEHLHGVAVRAKILVAVGDHVVEPPADNASRNQHQCRIHHHFGVAAPRHVSTPRQPHRRDNASDDAQRVGADRNRAEVPHTLRG